LCYYQKNFLHQQVGFQSVAQALEQVLVQQQWLRQLRVHQKSV
jgi:hypothetical protein